MAIIGFSLFEERAKFADRLAGSYADHGLTTDRLPSPLNTNAPRADSIASIQSRPRTYSCGTGVIFQQDPNATPSENDIIMVTVRLSNKERQGSIDDCLPERPPKRGFLRRMSTRILPPPDEGKYKAVKMPRGDYKRHFARDREGNYAGTEPRREWDAEDIEREYGRYWELPLRTVVC